MRTPVLFLLAAVLAAQDSPQEVRSTPRDRTNLDLTLYHPYSSPDGGHSGFGLLREHRRIRVPKGDFVLRWEGLPREVTPESAQLAWVAGLSSLTQAERNYDQYLLSPDSVFEGSLGTPVSLRDKEGRITQGELRSLLPQRDSPHGAGVIFQDAKGFHSVDPREIQFHALPKGLLSEPTLSTLLHADAEGEVELRLTLLVERMRWKAQYNLTMAEHLRTGHLDGFAILDNASGMAFDHVRLALVAGPVKREAWRALPSVPPQAPNEAQTIVEVVAAAALEPLGEAYLYSWPHPFTLGGHQTKQLALFSRAEVPAMPEIRCTALIGGGWSDEDLEECSSSLDLKVVNDRSAASPGPWPEGEWVIHVPAGRGLELIETTPADSIPSGESQTFGLLRSRIQGRSRLLESRRPWWGRFERIETWEVEYWREDLPDPFPPLRARLVLMDSSTEVEGPNGLQRESEWEWTLPLDLSQNPARSFRVTLKYPKKNPS